MSINFPASPTIGESVTLASVIYIWDGTAWRSSPMNVDNLFIGGSPWTKEMGDAIQLVNGSRVFVDTSTQSAIVLLPPSPNIGSLVRIVDAAGNSSVNNITILGNGQKILGQSTDMIVSTNYASLGLVYYNEEQGWLLTEK